VSSFSLSSPVRWHKSKSYLIFCSCKSLKHDRSATTWWKWQVSRWFWGCDTVSLGDWIIMPSFSRVISQQRMIFLWLLNLVILWNIKNRAPNDIVSYPRRPQSSAVPQCKSQFLQSTQVSLFIVPLVPFPYSVSLRWIAGILNIRVQEWAFVSKVFGKNNWIVQWVLRCLWYCSWGTILFWDMTP